MKTNISVSEAKKIIFAEVALLKEESVQLNKALHRYLSRDFVAALSNPPSDNSAMDGYGVKAQDVYSVPVSLKVVGTVYAGDAPKKGIKQGEAVEIMTGAPIPKGVDAVVPVEETVQNGEYVTILEKVSVHQHIRKKGEDYDIGDLLISKGARLTPAHLALLASSGQNEAQVFSKPKVAILPTGNELINPACPIRPGKIYESNSFGLQAQVEALGAIPVKLKTAKDNLTALAVAVQEGLRQDVLVISGGVSMGKADYIKKVMEDLGAKFHFSKIRQRPGNPFTFATVQEKPVFLVPGNPVSAPLCFEIYVRGFLQAMMGYKKDEKDILICVVGETIKVKKGKTYFLRVILKKQNDKTAAFLTGPQGSGILTSLSSADGILVVPEDVEEIEKGSRWPIESLSWSHSC